MNVYEKVYSTERPNEVECTEYYVYTYSNIQEATAEEKLANGFEEDAVVYSFTLTEYEKDEYILNSPTFVEAKAVYLSGSGDGSKQRLEVTVNATKGKHISFQSPFKSYRVIEFSVNGEDYDIVDLDGMSLLGKTNVWSNNAIISVVLDTNTHKAYMQNNYVTIKHYCSLNDLDITFPTTLALVCRALPRVACTLHYSIPINNSSIFAEGEFPPYNTSKYAQLIIEGGPEIRKITIVDSLGDEYVNTAVKDGPVEYNLAGWKKVATDTVEDISEDFVVEQFTESSGPSHICSIQAFKCGNVINVCVSVNINTDKVENIDSTICGINPKYAPNFQSVIAPVVNLLDKSENRIDTGLHYISLASYGTPSPMTFNSPVRESVKAFYCTFTYICK